MSLTNLALAWRLLWRCWAISAGVSGAHYQGRRRQAQTKLDHSHTMTHLPGSSPLPGRVMQCNCDKHERSIQSTRPKALRLTRAHCVISIYNHILEFVNFCTKKTSVCTLISLRLCAMTKEGTTQWCCRAVTNVRQARCPSVLVLRHVRTITSSPVRVRLKRSSL